MKIMEMYERENRMRAIRIFDNNYAVYILRCTPVEEDFVDEFAMDRIGSKPEWAREAVRHETIYYIGQTKNVFERIGQHLNGRGADFTRLFPVEAVMEVKLCSDRETSRAVEEAISKRYRPWEDNYCYFS